MSLWDEGILLLQLPALFPNQSFFQYSYILTLVKLSKTTYLPTKYPKIVIKVIVSYVACINETNRNY